MIKRMIMKRIVNINKIIPYSCYYIVGLYGMPPALQTFISNIIVIAIVINTTTIFTITPPPCHLSCIIDRLIISGVKGHLTSEPLDFNLISPDLTWPWLSLSSWTLDFTWPFLTSSDRSRIILTSTDLFLPHLTILDFSLLTLSDLFWTFQISPDLFWLHLTSPKFTWPLLTSPNIS